MVAWLIISSEITETGSVLFCLIKKKKKAVSNEAERHVVKGFGVSHSSVTPKGP